MKTMKYVYLTGALLIGSYGVSAQEKAKLTTAQEVRKDRTHHWEKELELTPEQIAKIQEIRKVRMEEKNRLRSQLKDLHREEKAEIQKLLSADQQKKWEQLREDRMKKHPNRKHKGKHSGGKQGGQ